MNRHRIPHLTVPNSQPQAIAGVMAGFVACPVALLPVANESLWRWQQALYQKAFDEAKASVRPTVVERLQAVTPN